MSAEAPLFERIALVGIASAAVAVVANHEMGPWGMWAWIQGLSGGSGSFMGALAGSLLGLTAILLGALYNAHLNRQRDDRIRRQDARSISQAIKAELATIKAALANNAEKMRSDERTQGGFLGPDVAHMIRVFLVVLPQIGPIR